MQATLSDPQRLQALEELCLLDSPPEDCFDRLTRLATRVLGVPVALVSLVDDHRQFFKSQQGLPEPWASQRQTPLSHSFCQYVVADNAVLNVEDAREHPRLHDNLAIPELGVIAYLGIPLTTSQGTPLGSFCAIDSKPRRWTPDQEAIMRDLAGAALSEMELRRLARELRDLNQEKNQLLGMAAHDLRTPLGVIAGYNQLLLSSDRFGNLSEGQRKLLDRSHRAAEYMLGLISSLLDVSKIECGALNLDFRQTRLDEVVVRAVELVQGLADSKQQLIEVQAVAVSARIDPDKILQVLMNLLGNAVKFSARERTVWITLEELPDQFKISVRDQGPGIGPKERDRLFKPFSKTSNRPTAGEASSGLGLAIARKIAEGHGGRIDLESEPGKGSTFSLILPAS